MDIQIARIEREAAGVVFDAIIDHFSTAEKNYVDDDLCSWTVAVAGTAKFIIPLEEGEIVISVAFKGDGSCWGRDDDLKLGMALQSACAFCGSGRVALKDGNWPLSGTDTTNFLIRLINRYDWKPDLERALLEMDAIALPE